MQGSGWVWLGQDPATGALSIRTTANQDTLAAEYKLTPLLGVDLWEHSYVRGRACIYHRDSACISVLCLWLLSKPGVQASSAFAPVLLHTILTFIC